VRDIATDPSDHAIVSAIVAMARNLNIQVVAEGIETWQQLEILRNMGCTYAQGFRFANQLVGRHRLTREILRTHHRI
jgi:EAL domain-containing protein (putative c-di-GMP-specific phosphodiesterase class I)